MLAAVRSLRKLIAFIICAPIFVSLIGYSVSGNISFQDDYVPPALSRPLLGTIPLDRATTVNERFLGGKKILKLPGGALYVDADMDIDADGSPRARALDPCCGQKNTAFSFPGQRGQAMFVNAEVVPYIVLPGNNRRARDRFFRRMGFEVGDIAAVIFRDKVEFALFADVGPVDKIGEGSIALAQALGHDPFITRRGRRIVGRSIPRDVIYIVFPRSRIEGLTPQNVVGKVQEKGRQLFEALGGRITP
jgi:hypothetical protein